MAKRTVSPSSSSAIQPRLLSEKQASARYGFSLSWFRRKRWEGGGPLYVKIGHSVRYPAKELETFFEGRGLVNSTSATRRVEP